MSSAGQKVTTDPESTQRPIQEGPGVVTSDSLAAESYNRGGDFSDKPGPQPSYSTTTNTTDTTNADQVNPPGERRGDDEEVYTGPPSGGKAAGVGPTYNVQSGSDTSQSYSQSYSQSSGGDGIPSTSGTVKSSSNEYRDNIEGKGRNVQSDGRTDGYGEGQGAAEFQGNEPNASFNNEIGTENDPGREAIRKFEQRNAESALDSGLERDTGSGVQSGEYDNLKETEA